MKHIPGRVVIYASDIVTIMGKTPRTAYRIIQQIRKFHNKTNRHPVMLHEFCSYMKMDEEIVAKLLR
jgi:hypothetical protein